jgi:opacity protein-like surface antigen
MSLRKWLVIAGMVAIIPAVSPRTVSAEWVVTPFLGWNFNGSADVQGTGGSDFSDKFEKKLNYGVSLATGSGPVGFELDFGYSPNFFETGTTGSGFDFTNDSNVTTLMANAIIGPTGGGAVRPYVVGGVGLIRTNVQDAGQFFDVTTKNDFGFDLGGGVMGFFSQNVGIRGDIRYFRSFSGSDENPTGLGVSDFNFWRGSVGVSFKF